MQDIQCQNQSEIDEALKIRNVKTQLHNLLQDLLMRIRTSSEFAKRALEDNKSSEDLKVLLLNLDVIKRTLEDQVIG